MNAYGTNKNSEGYLIPKNEVDNKIGYVQMVNAYVMHRRLHLKQDFFTWVNDCVKKFALKESVDFVFTKQEWNRQKICQKSAIKADKTNNHYFKIYTKKKVSTAECRRNLSYISNLLFSLIEEVMMQNFMRTSEKIRAS
ncbi:antA/AntB antirepressor family protein [Bartonella sp. ML70XJBT.G]|uniref:antA/AntB antirepressor family protein n=1 Tax=Bartonella sp. ML70XJBT.G TaxID=3019093 RepID=UPI00235E42B0|nr:antA/AntB antirepressor family protein [Bartonella sp. ML70XJBT.G]